MSQRDKDFLLNSAIHHHQRGDLANAEKEYRKAIESGLLHHAIFSNLGIICKNSGRREEAISLYYKAIEVNPNHPDAYTNLGNLYRDLGQFNQALTYTLKSLELNPNNPDCHTNLGVIYKNLGNINQALASTLKSLELNPNNPNAQMNLGGIYKELGNLNQAVTSTLKSLELNPDDPDALSNLGSYYRDLDKLDEALGCTLKSLELNPTNPNTHMNLGGIYKDLGNLDKALTATLKSLELNPNNATVYMNLGSIYSDLGDLDQALAATLKSLDLEPDNPYAQINLGIIYKDLGKLDQAINCLQKAIKNENTQEKAAIELAQTYFFMGKYHDGIEMIGDIQNKKACNLLLSLHLCLDNKHLFNQCATTLIANQWLDPQGIAAIDHANVLYNQKLDNGLKGISTIDCVFTQPINEKEFPNQLIEEILAQLSNRSIHSRTQTLLTNGSQTSGNILDLPERPFQVLKELLVAKIANYNQAYDVNTDKNFKANLQKNLYTLRGWAIVMNKGGNLQSHNHELGWLTGTFYLQMPDRTENTNEGAIEFTHQGPKYPTGTRVFKRTVIQPSTRDLNIFPSSVFHRTLPFQSDKQRICIAFDVTKNKDY